MTMMMMMTMTTTAMLLRMMIDRSIVAFSPIGSRAVMQGDQTAEEIQLPIESNKQKANAY